MGRNVKAVIYSYNFTPNNEKKRKGKRKEKKGKEVAFCEKEMHRVLS